MVKIRHTMKSHNRQASFYKQAMLIATPLIILSAVALYSLRQDKASIEQDARDRAQVLTPALADQLKQRVQKDLEEFLVAWCLEEYAPIALAWPEGSGIAQTADAQEIRALAQRAPTDLKLDALPQLRGRLLNGRVQTPVDYPRLPTPPAWPNELSPEQSSIWRTAEQALFQQRDPAAGRKALAAMRAGQVPEDACASTEFRLLLLEARRGAAPTQVQRLTDLAHKYPESCTESGTPIADLALVQALLGSTGRPILDSLRQELFHRVLRHPSFLTPELVAAAEAVSSDAQKALLLQPLRSLWLVQERTRTLLRSLAQHPLDPHKLTEIWLDADGQPILAQCEPYRSKDENMIWRPAGSSYSVTLIRGRLLEQAFLNALAETRGQLPSYLTATVQVGGRRWPATPHATLPDVELASESKVIVVFPDLPKYLVPSLSAVERDLEYFAWPDDRALNIKFAISLELARPDLLYAHYRQRLWLAAGLILSATAAAGMGLVSAWRAFQRQLRLAEMTSNFVSSVSHELRAPLASVRLMAESLDQGRTEDSEKRRDYFRLIVQECRRLSSLVENVLDFSHIHQGRKRYEFEPIDLAALMRQTVKLMEPNAGERHVMLVLAEPSPGGEELQPCWDGQAVQQALVNLIDNAIKHSPADAVVKVEYEIARAAAEPMIHLTVEDQGQGVPVEEQVRIFEPFYRRGSELRRETKGIGIGLNIVKHVAEAHGGRVLVESAIGHGSRFMLEMPLRMGPQSNADERR
ncbi:MAG: hypothetical protein LAP85_13130 [Acidobacteriia bacterium]|nr:hypothetical protein [Terriglobia bacterium]